MRIVITNTVTLNGGDAAILEGIVRTLHERWPEAVFDVFDSQAEVAQRYHPRFRYQPLVHGTLPSGGKKRWHERRLLLAARLQRRGHWRAVRLLCSAAERRALETICEADLVVSTGGTYLVEVYDLRHRIFELKLAAACGQPVVFFTQSLGPFRKPSSRAGLLPAFDGAPVILLRDERSRQHLLELGVDEGKLHVVPDAAFALADSGRLERAARGSPPRAPLKVAISVRSWKTFRNATPEEGMRRYRRAVADLIRHLVTHWDAAVELVSTCQGIPEYWAKDSETAAAIVRELDEQTAKAVSVDADFHTTEELMEILGAKDVVVATRMHAGILALCAGTPVLPIAYEFKTRELFSMLGMGDYVTDIDDASGTALTERLDRLVGSLPALATDLFPRIARLREEALGVADHLPARPAHKVRAELTQIARDVRAANLTYLSDQKLENIQRCLETIERERVPGDCLEAGVALGGSAIVICSLMDPSRRFTGYDVFGMIPPPGERDDDKSHRRYETIERGDSRGIGGDDYYGYRDDLYRDVVKAFEAHGLRVDGQRIALERGLFEDTLVLGDRAVAFAHLDCDWYDPVALCLDRIYPRLSPGGFIVSDDYHDYGGCRDAVDAFLASHPDVQVVSTEGNLVMRRLGG